uniref:Uncharacterized protein LOC111101932 n=1 Tax=Crassostrea virginica TaxID=6565 RepID=A0A8B8AIC2_CRAVI|nr:uncharacterized protein LOC111101932 [Crassostrea virginica]
MGRNNRHSSYYGNNDGKEKALVASEQENGTCKQRMIQRNSRINLTNDFNHSSKKRASTIGRTRLGTRFRSRNRCLRFRRMTEQPDQASDVMGQKATLRHPRRQFAALTSHQEDHEINIESETRENLKISRQKSNPHPNPVDNHTPTPENLQNDVITRHERETNIGSNIVLKYIVDGIQLFPGDAAGETYSGEPLNLMKTNIKDPQRDSFFKHDSFAESSRHILGILGITLWMTSRKTSASV